MFGLFFMANDAVADWTDVFLYSVRRHNPALPIVHIPFDENWDRIKPLLKKYRCDEIGLDMAPYDEVGAAYFPDNILAIHDYRRFSSFQGPFERFVFLDIDMLVMESLEPIAGAIFSSDKDICFYRYSQKHRTFADQALMDSMVLLYPEYGPLGYNAAFIASTRNAVTLDHLRRHMRRADTLRPLFGPAWCQASVNFCAATAGLRGVRLPQLMPDLTVNWHVSVDIQWNEERGCYVTGPNTIDAANELTQGPGGVVPGKRFVIIDWGGHKRPIPSMPYYEIWKSYADGAAAYSDVERVALA